MTRADLILKAIMAEIEARRAEIDRDLTLRTVSFRVRLDAGGRPVNVQYQSEAYRDVGGR